MSTAPARPPMPKVIRPASKTANAAHNAVSAAPKNVTATPKKTGAPQNTAPPAAHPAPAAVAYSPPSWLKYLGPIWSGVKGGAQAFIISFTLVTLLVLVALLAGSDSVSWGAALVGAVQFWLLAHGAPASFGELQLSIWPLGLTGVCLVVLRLTGRRIFPGVGGLLGGAITYALLTLAAARVAGEAPMVTATVSLGSLAVAGFGFLISLGSRWPTIKGWLTALPRSMIIGSKAAGLALLAMVGISAVLAAIWAVLGQVGVQQVAQTLQPDPIGAVVVGVSQLILLPNWLLWSMGWVTGVGFSLGANSLYSPALWQGGPLPAVPLMSALPPQTWAGPFWLWVPVLVLFVGALTGWYLWRALGEWATWRARMATAASTICVAALGMYALQWLASGSLGSGRLAQVGANAWLVSVVYAGELTAGIAMVIIGKSIGNRRPRLPLNESIPNRPKAVMDSLLDI